MTIRQFDDEAMRQFNVECKMLNVKCKDFKGDTNYTHLYQDAEVCGVSKRDG